MTPNQKQILSIVAAVVILAGFYVWGGKYLKNPSPASRLPLETSSPARGEEDKEWKTYRNEEYGFEVAIPDEWLVNEGKDFYYFLPRDSDETSFDFTYPMTVKVIPTNGRKLESIFNGQIERQLDFRNECRVMNINGNQIYFCNPTKSFAGEQFAIVQKTNFVFLIYLNMNEKMINQILSTFKFLK